jgi:hypothetical protein
MVFLSLSGNLGVYLLFTAQISNFLGHKTSRMLSTDQTDCSYAVMLSPADTGAAQEHHANRAATVSCQNKLAHITPLVLLQRLL